MTKKPTQQIAALLITFLLVLISGIAQAQLSSQGSLSVSGTVYGGSSTSPRADVTVTLLYNTVLDGRTVQQSVSAITDRTGYYSASFSTNLDNDVITARLADCNGLTIEQRIGYSLGRPTVVADFQNTCPAGTVSCRPDFTTTITPRFGNSPVVFDAFIANLPAGITPSYSWTIVGSRNGVNMAYSTDVVETSLPAGTYDVCLTAQIPGCSNILCKFVTIEEITCQSIFTATASEIPGGALVAFSSADLPAGIGRSWTVDGQQSSSADTFSLVLRPGSHIVCLDIATATGCTASSCDTIEVSAPTGPPCPEAYYTFTTGAYSNYCGGKRDITLTAAPNGSVAGASSVKYYWSTPNGPVTCQNGATARLSLSPGTYQICLNMVVVRSAGDTCRSVFCQNVTVQPAQQPAVRYSMGGNIYRSNNQPAKRAWVTAYRVVNGSHQQAACTQTDNCGRYRFDNLQAGSYLLKAELSSCDYDRYRYIPTWYQRSASWSQAQQISLSSNRLSTHISLLYSNSGGRGHGTCSVGGSAWATNETADMGNQQAAPLYGTQVTLMNSQGEPVATTKTDARGAWNFEGLQPGTYTVTADYLGREVPMPATVAVREAEAARVHMEVNDSEVTFKAMPAQPSATAIGSVQLYPNPASQHTTVQLTAAGEGTATIELVNGLGQTAWSTTRPLTGGQQALEIPLTGMPLGLYSLRILVNGVQQQHTSQLMVR